MSMKASRQRRPHTRSVKVLIPPSPEQPAAYVRITQDGEEAHYWVDAIPADFGKGFKLSKPGHEGGADAESGDYHVLLDGNASSCTCPAGTYHGYCKHVDGLRALDAAGKLPRADGYKPGHDSFIPF
jgi:hypothetical protein